MDYEFTYNIYDFDEEEPDTGVFDISHCFADDQKKNVQFKLSGDEKALMEAQQKRTTYSMYLSLIAFLGVRPIRIANLRVRKFIFVNIGRRPLFEKTWIEIAFLKSFNRSVNLVYSLRRWKSCIYSFDIYLCV